MSGQFQPFDYGSVPPPPRSNTLGIAGFVCSLLGIVATAGILSPIGLVLSLVAIGKQPRGFAVAGVVLGLIGSCGGLAILVAILAVGLAAVLAAVGISVAMVALEEPERIEMTSDMVRIVAAVEMYKEDNGIVPADLVELDIRQSSLVDPWSNRYRYHLREEDPGYDIVSAGEDQTFGTDDDVYWSRFDEVWEGVGNMQFKAGEDAEGGSVVWSFGELTFEMRGEDEKGTVIIRKGDRVFRIEGDEQGGRVGFDPPPDAPDSSDPPDAPPGSGDDDDSAIEVEDDV